LTMLRALSLKYDKVLVLQSQPEMMEQPEKDRDGMGITYDTVTWGDMMSIESISPCLLPNIISWGSRCDTIRMEAMFGCWF